MHEEQNKLIVALDVATPTEARRLVASLRGIAGMFKIGLQLFAASGPDLVREFVSAGEKIFLDLKFHDIPNTVAAAAVEAARLGVSMFNVHASGGSAMMRRTVAAVTECAAREGFASPAILGVTVLTSSDQNTLGEIGVNEEPAGNVARLAQLAAACRLNGVVASPQEISLIRKAVSDQRFLIVTPGVRPAGAERDDQARVMTPREAISLGADYLVIGRPIIAAAEPARAAELIIAEMRTGAAGSAA